MERGSLRPEHRPSSTSWLLVYPDTYEIGLPNQGLQILYEILNERDDAVAERGYAPWLDMTAEMRAAGVPLFSVDTHHAAADFDVFAFGLAASALWPGTLAGRYIELTGPARWVFLLVCFLFCLFAILFSAARRRPDPPDPKQ
jgi:hypothetical protein